MLLGSMGATNVTPNSPPSDAAVHSLGSHTLANENFVGFAVILSTPFLTSSFGLLVSKGVQDGLNWKKVARVVEVVRMVCLVAMVRVVGVEWILFILK